MSTIRKIALLSIALILVAFFVSDFYKDKKFEAEKPKYKTLIGVNAKETKIVNITNCIPDPDVTAIESGATVKFVNNDEQSHNLYFGKFGARSLPAKKSTDIKFDFYTLPGARKYDCDSYKDIGIISIFHEASPSVSN